MSRDKKVLGKNCVGAKGVEVETHALHLCMHDAGPQSMGATTNERKDVGTAERQRDESGTDRSR
jgi:GTP cyclohydrolase I